MVVSSVLHDSSVRGVLGVSKSIASKAFNNRAVFLNNRNSNFIDLFGVPSTTSVSLLSNGFYYGLSNATLYEVNAAKFISMNKKNTKK